MATAREPRQHQRHETKALLRAHLSAAAHYGPHSTRSCAVCHRLRRLVAEFPPEPFVPPECEPVEAAGRQKSDAASSKAAEGLPEAHPVRPSSGALTAPGGADGAKITETAGVAVRATQGPQEARSA